MAYFKINDIDFSNLVSSMKIGKETLVSENSGRNANGDTVIDVVNKKYKVYIGLRYTTDSEMQSFLSAIESYVVNVTFLNPNTKTLTTITAYTGTPEPEYFTIQNDNVFCKPMTINFIEL
jgi:hypothetical protein